MHNIEWIPSEPRSGFWGSWDKFFGPGATLAEERLQIVGGLFLAALLAIFLFLRRDTLNWTTAQTLLVALLAFDMIGGIITNATSAAKRWYHRPGQGARQHLTFIAAHGVHLFLIAAFFRDMDWAYFVVLYGYLLIAAVILLRFPLYLQRAVSLTLFCIGLVIGMYGFTPSPGLEWFIPFFYLKLLVSHLVKEAPFTPEPAR